MPSARETKSDAAVPKFDPTIVHRVLAETGPLVGWTCEIDGAE